VCKNNILKLLITNLFKLKKLGCRIFLANLKMLTRKEFKIFMTEFNNNKFVPQAPEQHIVAESNQPVKRSSLSAAARSKIINRSGSIMLVVIRKFMAQ